MPELTIQRIQEDSGIQVRTGETTREYIRRVGNRAGVSDEKISRTVRVVEEAQFAPHDSINDEKVQTFEDFLEVVSSLADRQEEGDEQPTEPETQGTHQSMAGEDSRTSNDSSVDLASTTPDSEEGTRNVTSEPSTSATPSQKGEESDNSSTSPSTSQTNQSTLTNASSSVFEDYRKIVAEQGTAIKHRTKSIIQSIKDSVFPSTYDIAYLLGIFLIGSFFYVRNLGRRSLRNWDEGIYATAAQHMVQSGDWITPQIEGGLGQIGMHPFLEKPPLAMWLEAISMQLFGFSEFAARFPAAVLTVFTALVIYLFARELQSRTAGVIAAFIWLSIQHLYIGLNGGRAGATDLPLVFFGTCFVVLTWFVARRDTRQYLPLVCLAAALAVLTKGFGAGPFVFVVAPLVIGNIHSFANKTMAKSVAGFFVLVAPWPIAMWSIYGDEFVQEIFVSQVLGRATGSLAGSSNTLFEFMQFPFFRFLPIYFDPWLFFLLPGVLALLAREYLEGDFDEIKQILFLVWWASFSTIFYAFTGNHGWYLFPAYVPASILVGWMFSRVTDRDPLVVGAAMSGLALTILFSFRSHLGTSLQGTATLPNYGFRTGILFCATIAVIVAILIGYRTAASVIERKTGRDDYMIVSHILPLVCIFIVLLALMGPTPPWTGMSKNIGTTIDNEVTGDQTVYLSDGLVEEGPHFSLSYYAKSPIASASTNDISNESGITYVLITEGELERLSRDYRVIRKFGFEDKYILSELP